METPHKACKFLLQETELNESELNDESIYEEDQEEGGDVAVATDKTHEPTEVCEKEETPAAEGSSDEAEGEEEEEEEEESFVVDEQEIQEDLDPNSELNPFDPIDPSNIIHEKRRRIHGPSDESTSSGTTTN